MKLAFYRDCEPHLDRRQFLKLVLVAGAIPAPVPTLFGGAGPLPLRPPHLRPQRPGLEPHRLRRAAGRRVAERLRPEDPAEGSGSLRPEGPAGRDGGAQALLPGLAPPPEEDADSRLHL